VLPAAWNKPRRPATAVARPVTWCVPFLILENNSAFRTDSAPRILDSPATAHKPPAALAATLVEAANATSAVRVVTLLGIARKLAEMLAATAAVVAVVDMVADVVVVVIVLATLAVVSSSAR
jgi:hypothetical protein